MARIVVIGARRRRQGTGEFVARWFADAGAEVSAVVGTSQKSAREASRTLEERYGIRARPYHDAPSALRKEAPDVVAICTPSETHREYLELVADAGIDCLCEKPLWWDSGASHSEETARLADAFVARGRHLSLVTQWPMTLPGFYELYPDAREERLESLWMWLCPMFPGARMIPDAVPHVVSLLEAVAGPGRSEAAEVRYGDEGLASMDASFSWRHARGVARVRLELRVKERAPRPAAYAVNGRRVDREIHLPDYSMSLRAGDRRVPIEDPLRRLIREFLARTGRSEPTDREALVEATRTLDLLTEAADGWDKG